VRRFIEQLGFAHPKKVYVAYLGAFEASSCGLATRGANAALVWLTCALGHPTSAPFSLIDSVAMHETLHALGAVEDECAPNGNPNGSIRDATITGGTRSLVARMSLIATSWTRTPRLAGAWRRG
jgi:hypothetical protein